jgi:RNA polymerase sigma-70 factor (ECF subfamily)
MDLTVTERVKEVVADLADGEREAIELAYLGGYSYREVAEMLAQPEGTVKSRLRSGLKKMRRELVDVMGGGGS